MMNITLGQYYPVDSPIHRLDPRTKILLTIALIVAVFLVHSLAGYALVLAFLWMASRLSHVPFKVLLKGLKSLRWILLLTFFLNLFFSGTGSDLVHWGPIRITDTGLSQATHYSLRLVFLVMCTSLMTLTTSPIMFSDGLEMLLSPLKALHFPAHELAMMMSIALRFIPTLLDETDKIMKAQMARGADLESGRLIQRAKAMIPILVPLFLSAFRRAGELATAMEARCYRGDVGRTRMKELKYQRRDIIAYMILLLFAGLLIATRYLPDIPAIIRSLMS